jgi:hypothetical protein
MTEEEWTSYSAPSLKGDGPRETGDPLVDEWERQLEAGTLDF